jgi:glycine cleavage system H protein
MPEHLEITVDKFIFRVAADRLYTEDGIWAQGADAGKLVRVGLSDYFQQRIGDVAFVRLKQLGTKLAVGDPLAELETIKANADLYSPVGGVMSEYNQSLDLYPENINQDPYGKGWVAVIEAHDWPAAQIKLLKPQEYLSVMRAQAEEELNKT